MSIRLNDLIVAADDSGEGVDAVVIGEGRGHTPAVLFVQEHPDVGKARYHLPGVERRIVIRVVPDRAADRPGVDDSDGGGGRVGVGYAAESVAGGDDDGVRDCRAAIEVINVAGVIDVIAVANGAIGKVPGVRDAAAVRDRRGKVDCAVHRGGATVGDRQPVHGNVFHRDSDDVRRRVGQAQVVGDGEGEGDDARCST